MVFRLEYVFPYVISALKACSQQSDSLYMSTSRDSAEMPLLRGACLRL